MAQAERTIAGPAKLFTGGSARWKRRRKEKEGLKDQEEKIVCYCRSTKETALTTSKEEGKTLNCWIHFKEVPRGVAGGLRPEPLEKGKKSA